jgi:replication factor A2
MATQVHFIGHVREVLPQQTNRTYRIDDGTAVMDVKQWVDADSEAAEEGEKHIPKESDYVHVYGTLKEFNNKRHVAPQAIRPITDFNEINYHLLQATAMHLYFTRGPIDKANGVKSEGGGGQGLFVDGNGTGANGHGGKKLPPGMTPISRKVYEFLQNSPQNNEGLHVHEIARQLGVPATEVFKSGDELILQGLIYTTIDDETWAVLE